MATQAELAEVISRKKAPVATTEDLARIIAEKKAELPFDPNTALQGIREGKRNPLTDMMAGNLETVEAIGGEAAGMVVGGLAGLAATSPVGLATGLTDEDTAANVVEDVRGAFSNPPETEQGIQTVETLGDLATAGIDLMNIPIAGTAQLVELATGRTDEEAAAVAESIKQKGFPATFADSVYEKTGSPFLAALSHTAPNAVVEMLGVLTGARLARTSPLKEKLAEQMRADPDSAPQMGASPDVAPADEWVQVSPEPGVPNDLTQVRPETDLSVPGPSDRNVATLMLDGADKVVNNPRAIDAIKNGVDAGVVSAMTASNPVTQAKLAEMTKILRRTRENSLYGVDNAAGDVAGRSVLDAVKHIKKVNTDAGKEIDRIAKKELTGQPIDISAPSAAFAEALDDFGITVTKNKKGEAVVNFKNSNVAPGDRSSLKEVIRQILRLHNNGPLDAAKAHELKRIIDRNVTYGKNQKGLGGDPEKVLKAYRTGINESLKSTYDNYRIANENYAETIGGLDEIQRLAGTKLDLFGPGADGAVYQMLRGYLNNTKSRASVVNAVENLYKIANKHGAGLQDDIRMQVLYADELDAVFPPAKRGSFQSLIERATARGAKGDRTVLGTAEEVGGVVIEKMKGNPDENALKALEKLLEAK